MKNLEQQFARAMFELSQENGEREIVREELHLIEDVLKQNPTYGTLLDTPAITREEKLSLVENAFASLGSENVKNLMKLLTERRECHLFSSIVRAFDALYDEALGILRVEAITAYAMTDAQKTALEAKLAKKTQKTIVLTNIVKPEVLGGVLLRYGEVQLDGTLKNRLDTLAESISDVIVE